MHINVKQLEEASEENSIRNLHRRVILPSLSHPDLVILRELLSLPSRVPFSAFESITLIANMKQRRRTHR